MKYNLDLDKRCNRKAVKAKQSPACGQHLSVGDGYIAVTFIDHTKRFVLVLILNITPHNVLVLTRCN